LCAENADKKTKRKRSEKARGKLHPASEVSLKFLKIYLKTRSE